MQEQPGTTDETTTRPQVPPVVKLEYAGFWIRFLASVLDSILISFIVVPLLLAFYDIGDIVFGTASGAAYYLISYGLPLVAIVIFWKYRAATPGKIWMGIHIVDADTLGSPSTERLVIRYLGYYVSLLPFFLGFIWVAFDSRKQGWHDKMAHTLVIKDTSVIPAGGLQSPNPGPGETGTVPDGENDEVAGADGDPEAGTADLERPVKKDPWIE